MRTVFNGTPNVATLLNSSGELTPLGDTNRMCQWIENGVDKQQRKSAMPDSSKSLAG
jgi:hypothetical protein